MRAVVPLFLAGIFLSVSLPAQESEKKPPTPIEIKDEPRAVDPSTLLPAALAAPVTIEFKESSLTDVVKWLQTQQKLGVIVEQAALSDAGILTSEPISDKLEKAPLYLLLDRLRTVRIGWYLEEGLVHLTTLEIAQDKTRTVFYNIGDLFDAGYDSDSLLEVITSAIDPDSWDEVGGNGSVVVLGDVLFVSQSTARHLQVAGLLSALRNHGRRTYILDAPVHDQLRAALAKPVSVDFQDVPLAAAIDELAKQSGADIRLDRLSLGNARIRDRQPVSLTLADQKLSVVLQALLERLHLASVIRDGAIWIEQRNADHSYLKAAVYDVRDLCRNSDESYALLDAVESQLAPDRWSKVGGQGHVEFPKPGVMVVLQTEPLHDKLLELLENYRSALRISKPRPRPESDPKEILTRYYRMPEAMAADLEKALPKLIQPETWQSETQPAAPGTILKLASKAEIELPAGAKPDAIGVATPYAVLVIKQTRAVHDALPDVLQKVKGGEVPEGGLGGGGGGGGGAFGGGGFGGGIFQ